MGIAGADRDNRQQSQSTLGAIFRGRFYVPPPTLPSIRGVWRRYGLRWARNARLVWMYPCSDFDCAAVVIRMCLSLEWPTHGNSHDSGWYGSRKRWPNSILGDSWFVVAQVPLLRLRQPLFADRASAYSFAYWRNARVILRTQQVNSRASCHWTGARHRLGPRL